MVCAIATLLLEACSVRCQGHKVAKHEQLKVASGVKVNVTLANDHLPALYGTVNKCGVVAVVNVMFLLFLWCCGCLWGFLIVCVVLWLLVRFYGCLNDVVALRSVM